MRASVLLLALGTASCAWSAQEVVVDFESAVPLLADHKANRVSRWEEKGVVFTLAHDPQQTKGKGLLMFFTHLSTGRKGIFRFCFSLGAGRHACASRSFRRRGQSG
jgi:hypothetical protein